MQLQIEDLRVGNYLYNDGVIVKIDARTIFDIWDDKGLKKYKPIPITEELLLKVGLSTINENSAGKRYGYVVNGIFNSDLTFTFWKTTKEAGKFFRGDLELKSFHQIQNIYWDLSNIKLKLI